MHTASTVRLLRKDTYRIIPLTALTVGLTVQTVLQAVCAWGGGGGVREAGATQSSHSDAGHNKQGLMAPRAAQANTRSPAGANQRHWHMAATLSTTTQRHG
jgi:hypothetical protein